MNDASFHPERKTARQLSGLLGEDAAARYYEAAGYTMVDRNVHMSRNEIDLIMKNDTHIVFIEVKTRHASPGVRSRYGRPADAVDQAKRSRTVEAAKAYLRAHKEDFPAPLQPRIDVVEVYLRHTDGGDEVAEIKAFRNAFGAR